MSLDPTDWNDYRKQAHKVLDDCIDHLENVQNNPWQPIDSQTKNDLAPKLPKSGASDHDIAELLTKTVLPTATGNIHPKFFGWVHGTGLTSGLMAEIVAATMNSNCGGRDHGATYMERCVIDWAREIFDFPEDASGLLTVGTSQASIIALACARSKLFGTDIRHKGVSDLPKVKAYCRTGTHSCISKALELMGHGSDCIVDIPTLGPSGSMDIGILKDAVQKDRSDGFLPLAVVGTAGSVNTGAFDDLDALADFCTEEDIWLHVDGAFGAWTKIAEAPWSELAKGIERSDSVAFDFHKWMSVQYDCGAVLVRDGDLHYNTFANRPAYLAKQAKGLGGGDLWFCDFGTDLSRGFRALKVWTAFQAHGLDAFSSAITENCKQAAYMAELVEHSDHLELAAPVVSNVCVFRVLNSENAFNSELVHKLQEDGACVFSTTTIDGKTLIRAAIVNHRTQMQDIESVINAVIEALEK